MSKEVFLTDAQLIEGFAGAFGQIISYHFFNDIVFKNNDLKNLNIVLGLSFLTTWIIRKIFMNIYVNSKISFNLGVFYVPTFFTSKSNDKKKNKFFLAMVVFFALLAIVGVYTSENPINVETIYIFITFIILYYLLLYKFKERKIKESDIA